MGNRYEGTTERSQHSIDKMRDPKFYLENFTKIKTKRAGALDPFILNNAQKDLYNELRRSNRIMILKARQLGFSTGVTGYFYHNTITVPGTNTALIGYNSDLTAELLDKIKLFYKTTPSALRPTIEYNSKYEISFPKLNSKILVLPSTMNVGRGYTINNCLAGDTKVLTQNGGYKEIRSIKKGDIVLNGHGGSSKVSAVGKKKNTKRTLRIKSYGHYDDLIVTEDHRILCREGGTGKAAWKEAREIRPGGYIAFPYFQCRNRVKVLEIKDYIKKGYKKRSNACPKKIDVNYAFGEFAGWYLAEGHIDEKRNRIIFCINKGEIEKIKKVIEPFRKYFGSIRIKTRKGSLSTTINLEGANFARFIESIFGRVENKRIDDCIWYWGWSFGKGLIYGLFAGDGYLKKKDIVILTNTNEQVVNQVKKLLVSLRVGLSYIRKSKSVRYGKRGRDRFDLMLGGKGNYKFRRIFKLPLPVFENGRARWRTKNTPWVNQGGGYWKRGRFYYWGKVYEVLNEFGVEDVYDISIEKEPHSFTTVSGVVHNCLITELSSWENAEDKMIQLEASVPINGKIVIESTPRGVGNLYHRMWMSDNDYAKKEYGWWWGYSKEEINIIRKRVNNPAKFAQEYGLEFLASGRSVFETSIIKEQRRNVLRLGDEVVYSDGKKGIVRSTDGLVIYKEPRPEGLYVCGVDTSEGVEGGDYSVATFWNRRTGEEVASYRGMLPPDKFGEKLNQWGRRYNDSLMVIEINNHGLTTLLILKQKIYPSLYFRPAKFDTMGSRTSDKMGWKTTLVTKPLLIDEFSQALRDGVLTLHSKNLVDEMSVFVFNDRGNYAPQEGFHDDSIFSAAIGFQGFKSMYSTKLEQLDYQRYLPSTFAY